MATAASNTAQSVNVSVQRCDRFIARTMNWLYDHLRCLPRGTPVVLSDALENRDEFPELTAWHNRRTPARAIWRRMTGSDIDPFMLRRLRALSPQVLHSHFGYVAVDDYALWKSLDVPWLIGFYGADVYALGRQDAWRSRYAKIFEACARVLALGPVMGEHLARLGCPAEKIVVHPLGVDITELHETPRRRAPGEPLRVLFAGTYREKKGLRYALDAVAAARKAGADIEFHVVAGATDKPGDRETEAEALAHIEHLGLGASVVRYGFVAFKELLSLALRSHVFLAPSVTAQDGDAEGTPFVLQQMMTTAMPCIATRHSDIPYIFGELESLLVEERDAEAITKRLLEYAADADLLVEHGLEMRKQMVENFDARACAARLSDIYDDVWQSR